MDARLTTECASGQFSGIVVVHVAGREVYNKSCGTADVPTQQPVTRERRFKIFSTTKLLTATAIMRLVELDRMELDAPVARYLPELPAAWRAVTVRHLLQHTSGLPDRTQALLDAFKTTHSDAMRSVLAAAADSGVAPASEPGARWSYNNFGYELLAEAGSRVTGKPFDQVLLEHVFVPAGMCTAVVDRMVYVDGKRQSAPDPVLLAGYNGAPDKLSPATSYSFVQLGAGSVLASVDDLLAFDRALTSGAVVSPETWRTMTESRVRTIADDTTRGWGLGVRLHELDGVRMQTHSGGNNGYVSNFVRYPDHNAVHVVLANRGFVQPSWMAEAVARVLGAQGPPR